VPESLGQPVDPVVRGRRPVGAWLREGGCGFGSEEELAEELVLPHAEAEATGDPAGRADHGERFEVP
jgi:hypothetical protein